jgi:hypothetical protein
MVIRHLAPEHQAQRLFFLGFGQLDSEAFTAEYNIGVLRDAGTAEKQCGQEQ